MHEKKLNDSTFYFISQLGKPEIFALHDRNRCTTLVGRESLNLVRRPSSLRLLHRMIISTDERLAAHVT